MRDQSTGEDLAEDRFFLEGEEPPARHDLDDELDYVITPDYEFSPRTWFLVAKEHYLEFLKSTFVICLGYLFGVWMFGWHPALCWLGIALEPLLLAALNLRAVRQLTGHAQFRSRRLYAREYFPLLGYNVVLLFLFCLAMLVGSAIWIAADEYLETAGRLGASLLLTPFAIGLFALDCRLFRFAPYFIIDQRLSLLQSLRASWRVWRGHFWAFLGLEFLSFFMQIAGVLFFGVGFFFVKPLTTLFWTCAYLESVRHRPVDPIGVRSLD